jgi:ABC-type Zn uptake system ZnuABC Zn-binding protein ZnuA
VLAAARPNTPLSSITSTSIVGLPRESRISRAIISFIFTFLKDNDVVVVPVVEPTTSNASKDAYEQLRKLKEMYDEGILTQEEFEEKKKQYLDNL